MKNSPKNHTSARMKSLRNKKISSSLLLTLFTILPTAIYAGPIPGGNYNLSHGWNYLGRADVHNSLTMSESNGNNNCVYKSYYFLNYSSWYLNSSNSIAKSSDSLANGFLSSDGDVVLVFRGGQIDGQNLNNKCEPTPVPPGNWDSTGIYSVSPKMTQWDNQFQGGITEFKNNEYYRWQQAGKTITSHINSDVYVYIGPNAQIGKTYKLSTTIMYMQEHGVNQTSAIVSNDMSITVKKARSCTVSTDNTITFPPVDVSDAKNNQALANKTGNLTVNCDDGSNTPVTVEIQGTKGRYTDTMALTMKDGSDAPAEIRGFIGTDIPLTGQCNGRLDGYPGIVYFIPNAGLEKMTLTPGANKYNWVLCSKGQNKTGQATGSAKLILNWD